MFLWEELTHPYPKFNIVEVQEQMSNYIWVVNMIVIIHPCPNPDVDLYSPNCDDSHQMKCQPLPHKLAFT